MNKVEVGVVTGHPIKIMFLQIKSIYKTWRFAKKHGGNYLKWYGVYREGTEIIVAYCGCSEYAERSAIKIAEILNEQSI